MHFIDPLSGSDGTRIVQFHILARYGTDQIIVSHMNSDRLSDRHM
jgi:hypothetical protein